VLHNRAEVFAHPMQHPQECHVGDAFEGVLQVRERTEDGRSCLIDVDVTRLLEGRSDEDDCSRQPSTLGTNPFCCADGTPLACAHLLRKAKRQPSNNLYSVGSSVMIPWSEGSLFLNIRIAVSDLPNRGTRPSWTQPLRIAVIGRACRQTGADGGVRAGRNRTRRYSPGAHVVQLPPSSEDSSGWTASARWAGARRQAECL